jgi:hypothetical protein
MTIIGNGGRPLTILIEQPLGIFSSNNNPHERPAQSENSTKDPMVIYMMSLFFSTMQTTISASRNDIAHNWATVKSPHVLRSHNELPVSTSGRSQASITVNQYVSSLAHNTVSTISQNEMFRERTLYYQFDIFSTTSSRYGEATQLLLYVYEA